LLPSLVSHCFYRLRAQALDLPDRGDFEMLSRFKDPEAGRQKYHKGSSGSSAKDFGDALEPVLARRLTTLRTALQREPEAHAASAASAGASRGAGGSSTATGTSEGQQDMTLGEVNEWLDRLAMARTAEEREGLFREVVQRLGAREQKWLVRVILGDMRLGIKHDSILTLYHVDALECYHSTLSLSAVFRDPALRDPKKRARFGISVMNPFTPVLANKLVMDDRNFARLQRDWPEFYIERKLDGERMLIHWQKHPPAAPAAAAGGGGGAGSAYGAASQGGGGGGYAGGTYGAPSGTYIPPASTFGGSSAASSSSTITSSGPGSARGGSGSGRAGGAGPRIRVLSRNSVENDKYAKALRRAIEHALGGVEEAIVDGEMMAWDNVERKFLPFGQTETVAGEMLSNPHGPHERQLCFMAFDVVWVRGYARDPTLNGDLTPLPLKRRKAVLSEVIRPVGFTFEALRADLVSASRPQERKTAIIGALEAAIDRGDEGIMIKHSTSPYEFGERSDKWLKVKPEYAEGGAQLLDLVIIGGYFGSRKEEDAGSGGGGRRGAASSSSVSASGAGGAGSGRDAEGRMQYASHFLLGVWEKPVDPDLADRFLHEEAEAAAAAAAAAARGGKRGKAAAAPARSPLAAEAIPRVRAFGKVGSGYSRAELKSLNEALAPHWDAAYKGKAKADGGRVSTAHVRMPPWLCGWAPAKQDDIPDVILDHPLHGIVVETKAAEIGPSDTFNAGLTIRFPRVVRIRGDKPPAQAEHLAGMEALYAETGGRLARKVDAGELRDAGLETHRRRAAKRQRVGEDGRPTAGGGRGGGALLSTHAWSTVEADVVTDVLGGARVWLLPMDPADRERSMAAVKQLGGDPVKTHALGDVAFAVSTARTIDAQIACREHKDVASKRLLPAVDVLRPEYLQACLDAGRRVDLEPQYAIELTPASQAAMLRIVDPQGDHHFRVDAGQDTLELISRYPPAAHLQGHPALTVGEAEPAADGEGVAAAGAGGSGAAASAATLTERTATSTVLPPYVYNPERGGGWRDLWGLPDGVSLRGGEGSALASEHREGAVRGSRAGAGGKAVAGASSAGAEKPPARDLTLYDAEDRFHFTDEFSLFSGGGPFSVPGWGATLPRAGSASEAGSKLFSDDGADASAAAGTSGHRSTRRTSWSGGVSAAGAGSYDDGSAAYAHHEDSASARAHSSSGSGMAVEGAPGAEEPPADTEAVAAARNAARHNFCVGYFDKRAPIPLYPPPRHRSAADDAERTAPASMFAAAAARLTTLSSGAGSVSLGFGAAVQRRSGAASAGSGESRLDAGIASAASRGSASAEAAGWGSSSQKSSARSAGSGSSAAAAAGATQRQVSASYDASAIDDAGDRASASAAGGGSAIRALLRVPEPLIVMPAPTPPAVSGEAMSGIGAVPHSGRTSAGWDGLSGTKGAIAAGGSHSGASSHSGAASSAVIPFHPSRLPENWFRIYRGEVVDWLDFSVVNLIFVHPADTSRLAQLHAAVENWKMAQQAADGPSRPRVRAGHEGNASHLHSHRGGRSGGRHATASAGHDAADGAVEPHTDAGEYRTRAADVGSDVFILSTQWVVDCRHRGVLLPVDPYLL
jgi:ATP-dependent DNA ligase